jgi:Na+/H+ antiporter NhaD/arsenite permease-like protein
VTTEKDLRKYLSEIQAEQSGQSKRIKKIKRIFFKFGYAFAVLIIIFFSAQFFLGKQVHVVSGDTAGGTKILQTK